MPGIFGKLSRRRTNKGGTFIPPSSPFDPTTVANLQAWYDATDLSSVTKDGSNLVSQLNDKSGNANHLLQATGGNKPTYNASDGANNKAYIAFANGKNLLLSSFSKSQPYTIYFVARQNSMVSGGNLVSFQSGTAYNGLGQLHDATFGDYFCPVAGTDYLDTNNCYKNDYAVFRFNVNGNTSRARINKEVNFLSSYNIGTASTSQLQLGKDTSFNFHELLFYNGIVSDADDDDIMNYLNAKYATSNYDYIVWQGDSITYGINADNRMLHSYAALVSKERGKNYYNNGISGAKLYQGGAESGVNSLYKATKSGTGWVVMGYCHNDSGVYNNGTWKNTYKSLIGELKAAGYSPSKIIITNHVFPDPDGTGGPWDYSYVGPMNIIISEIASEEGIILGDIYGYMAAHGGIALQSPDGLHPSTSGHRAIADYLKTLIT
jgi:lysophospholipase L1-like esterase